MAKIKIVTDSSITIEPQVVEDLEITIVPLSVMVDGVVYSDADKRRRISTFDEVKKKSTEN